MKWFHANTVRDAGYSLVEVMVAITLFVAVATITGTLIVQANQTTRRATAAAVAQSQLQDTVLRVSREVAVSDPLTIAGPTQLETLTVRGGTPVRTRFWYAEIDSAKHTGEIRSISATNPATLPPGEIATGYKVVAKDVTDQPTAPADATLTPRIRAFVDGNSGRLVTALPPLLPES